MQRNFFNTFCFKASKKDISGKIFQSSNASKNCDHLYNRLFQNNIKCTCQLDFTSKISSNQWDSPAEKIGRQVVIAFFAKMFNLSGMFRKLLSECCCCQQNNSKLFQLSWSGTAVVSVANFTDFCHIAVEVQSRFFCKLQFFKKKFLK